MTATVAVHATAVVIRERGVLIRGPSGAGKSSLALLLLEAARQRGWFARLVGDDRLRLEARHGALLAQPHPAVAGLIERRGQGIARVPHEPRCRVALVVDLHPPSEPPPRLPDPEAERLALAGAEALPRLALGGPPTMLLCGIIFDALDAAPGASGQIGAILLA